MLARQCGVGTSMWCRIDLAAVVYTNYSLLVKVACTATEIPAPIAMESRQATCKAVYTDGHYVPSSSESISNILSHTCGMSALT